MKRREKDRTASNHRLSERPDSGLRILLLSQYFPPEVGATQARMQSFAEYLSERGHGVTVICEFPNHPHGVLPPEYRGRIFEDDSSHRYRVLRVWVKSNRVKTHRTRMAFYVSYMALATAAAPLAGRADVVLATTPPLFAGAAGLAIAQLTQARFVLDVRDLWPAAAVSLGEISDGWPLRLAERLERRLYRSADLVTTVTRPFCDHIDPIRGRQPGAVHLPNGTDERFFVDGDGSARAVFGIPEERFLITFAGTHGIAQGLPSVLDAAEQTNGDIHFAFVGDGPVKDAIVAEAARRRLSNVSFHAQVQPDAIPPILGASDALLVPLSAHPTFASFVPSKLFDYMATGRPVVLSAAGEAARILTAAGAGIAVPPEDPEAIAAAATWLSKHPSEAVEMGIRGRFRARSHSRLAQAKRLEQIMLDVTGGAHAW
jgi:glycosyltransferase involved in cell wall biosynthesis